MIAPFAIARTLADEFEAFDSVDQLARRLVELRGAADRDLILIDAVWASKEEPTGRRIVAVRGYVETDPGRLAPAALVGYAFVVADAGADERATLSAALLRADSRLSRGQVFRGATPYTNREALICAA